MRYAAVLEKAVHSFNCGDIDGAISAVEKFLKTTIEREWLSTYARAYLYLGALHRWKGNNTIGLRIQRELTSSPACSRIIHGNAWVEQAMIHKSQQDYDRTSDCLAKARDLIEQLEPNAADPDIFKLNHHYSTTYANLQSRMGYPETALESYHRALDSLISLKAFRDCTRDFITTYLNIYNVHMTLGHIPEATEYLTLAHAKMKTLDSPYAFGLVHFFENLATFNLFAANSSLETINSLNAISEEVVNNFADFRRVFDFFSSIIVQLHEGKFDVEEIREQIKAYGDDPLIKAYIPTLLYGAPPPGSDNGDNDIPSARLT